MVAIDGMLPSKATACTASKEGGSSNSTLLLIALAAPGAGPPGGLPTLAAPATTATLVPAAPACMEWEWILRHLHHA